MPRKTDPIPPNEEPQPEPLPEEPQPTPPVQETRPSGLIIVRAEPPPGLMADRALWLDPAGNLVEEDDPTARSLLMRKDGPIDPADAARHRLASVDGKIVQRPAGEPSPNLKD